MAIKDLERQNLTVPMSEAMAVINRATVLDEISATREALQELGFREGTERIDTISIDALKELAEVLRISPESFREALAATCLDREEKEEDARRYANRTSGDVLLEEQRILFIETGRLMQNQLRRDYPEFDWSFEFSKTYHGAHPIVKIYRHQKILEPRGKLMAFIKGTKYKETKKTNLVAHFFRDPDGRANAPYFAYIHDPIILRIFGGMLKDKGFIVTRCYSIS